MNKEMFNFCYNYFNDTEKRLKEEYQDFGENNANDSVLRAATYEQQLRFVLELLKNEYENGAE